MISETTARRWRLSLRRVSMVMVVFLVIEFLDELVFGAREAAWPIVRNDLHLSYEQVGLLLSVPILIADLIEPGLFILADVWKRRVIILIGAVGFFVSTLLTAASGSFVLLMIAFTLFGPSSGLFVSLSQATLMDLDPSRHEQNMARWTFAGSAGVVSGSLLISALLSGSGGWRLAFVLCAALTLIVGVFLWRMPFPAATNGDDDEPLTLKTGLLNALRALRRFDVVRWLALLHLSDLMLDILLGYLALYFVDVVGLNEEQAALAVGIWTVIGLVGDFLLIPLLERVRGLDYLRVSAVVEFILFPIFLLTPSVAAKLICIGLIGMFNSGWYAILKGQLFSALPDQSGTAQALDSISGMAASLIPLGIGIAAEHFGLASAMWLFLIGPIGLLIGLPRGKGRPSGAHSK